MTKLLLNSFASIPGAKFTTSEIKYFYMKTLMLQYKYMRISITMINQDIINAYNLLPLVNNGHLLIKICKGM